ncbi:hypothetical protein CSA17_03235 [bacterium DOLJORAL78_65_58]|nr:MAG: hypothetical protein CSB20_01160 [bacterium DOLZORAL124_64_63]PIE76256.1 MAG: hypothetical protein CSA17_03235 [bacterium DOLJORAL78_65_58]
MKILPTITRRLPLIGMVLFLTAGAALADDGLVVIEDNGDETVVIIDTEQLGRLIGTRVDEALANLDEAMATMKDLQLEIRLGHDNMISVETADEAFAVDLDDVFHKAETALETALEDWDTETADLERELEGLKKELHRLQRELVRTREL